MVDVDTFLTTLSIMVDDFCKTALPPAAHPEPEAALSRSETVTSIHLSPARQGGEPYAGVPRGREHPLGQGRGESPAREAPVSSRAEGRGSTRLYWTPASEQNSVDI